jgi:hypothetical protein
VAPLNKRLITNKYTFARLKIHENSTALGAINQYKNTGRVILKQSRVERERERVIEGKESRGLCKLELVGVNNPSQSHCRVQWFINDWKLAHLKLSLGHVDLAPVDELDYELEVVEADVLGHDDGRVLAGVGKQQLLEVGAAGG